MLALSSAKRSRRRPKTIWNGSWRSTSKASFGARSMPFRRCGVLGAAPLLTSPRRRVWWGVPMARRRTRRRRVGVRLLTKATALQHATDHIPCNSVHPGPVETAMLQEALADPTTREERLRRVPLGRVGTVDDIAYGVLYLASDESSFVTGSELVIDGGS